MSDRTRIPLWLWTLAVVAIVLLVVAVVGRYDGPSIRAIPADQSMTDDQAREVAEKTLLVWARERNAGNPVNLREMTCPDPPDSWVSRQLIGIEEGGTPPEWDIVALTGFARAGSTWTLNGLGRDHGGMFTLKIDDGRLRVCATGPVPVPTD